MNTRLKHASQMGKAEWYDKIPMGKNNLKVSRVKVKGSYQFLTFFVLLGLYQLLY